jgi:hypothetical protein
MLRVSATSLSAWALALVALLASGTPAVADENRWFKDGDNVFIRQHEQFVRIFEPDVHLSRARRSFVKDHTANAADELEKAAGGFAYFADRATGDERKEIEAAGIGLTKLADDVRARRVGEITNFDRALLEAKRILARETAPPAPAKPPEPK